MQVAKLDLAFLSTRVDLEDRLTLFDPTGGSYNSLVPKERPRFDVHEVLVGACS